MSKYHKILGISEKASKSEIKEAYRTLAKKLHPDRNKASNANDQFAQLQEAYDALMDDNWQSHQNREKAQSSAASKPESPQDRIRKARERMKAQRAQEEAANERYYQSLVNSKRGNFVKIGAWICTVISLCYLLEAFLPYHNIPDQISEVSNSIGTGRMLARDQIIYTKSGEKFEMDLTEYSWAVSNREIIIEKTWFFQFPVTVKQHRPLYNIKYYVFREFYEKTWIPFLFFIVPGFLLIYKKRTITFTATYMFSFYVVIPIALLFLLFQFRWLHVITLGFL